MANISKEVWVEDLEKLADGTYKRKNHIAKARNGVTFDEHLADLMSQDEGKGADMIGLPDPNNLFTATNIGGAMQELFTNVSNGKSLVGGAITDVDESVVIPTDPSFQDLATAIGQISTGKKWASGSMGIANGKVVVNNLGFKPSMVFLRYWYDGNVSLNMRILTANYGYYNVIGMDMGISSDIIRGYDVLRKGTSHNITDDGFITQIEADTTIWYAWE